MARQARPRISDGLLDELLAGEDPREAFRSGELLGALQKAIAERALGAEMAVHLGNEEEVSAGNQRNGHNRKRVLTGSGSMEVAVPRDRQGRFEPQLIEKWVRRLPGFDEKVISMYGGGMTTREIRAHVEELYGVTVSRELISKVTDEIHEELREWRSRPLEAVYPIVYFDALRVKIRDEGVVQNKAVHLAIGVTPLGRKEILGMWTAANEGAKFWLRVMNELQARGVRDVLIAVVDGLKGFPEAIETVFPEVTVQTCIVHLIRYSLAHAFVEDAQGSGVGAAADLPGGDGGGGRGGAGRVRGGPVGSEVPGDRSELAAELGADHPVLRVLDADPAGDLHDERDREPEQHGAAGGADAGAFPERPSGGKADLPDAAEGGAEVEPAAVILVPGARRVRDPVRRPVPGGGGVRRVRPVAGTATGPPVSPRVGAGRVPAHPGSLRKDFLPEPWILAVSSAPHWPAS